MASFVEEPEPANRLLAFASAFPSCAIFAGGHARGDRLGQVAELVQYPDGAAGAAAAHDLQGEHEASSAARGPNLYQLSFVCLHLVLLLSRPAPLASAHLPPLHPHSIG